MGPRDRLGLTEMQATCLRGRLEGKSDKVIARELDVHPNTVNEHIRAACNRLRVDNTKKVFEWLYRHCGAPTPAQLFDRARVGQ